MADDDAPVTVTMKATKLHTYHDQEYDVGDTYEADEGDATTIEVQGKGVRVDRPDNALPGGRPARPAKPDHDLPDPDDAKPKKKK
jgi:hypothetical protein